MLRWRSDLPGVRKAFTSRAGGVSAAPYAGLNLGDHVGDDPEHVRRNRELLADSIGLPADRLVFMDQVHGADVVVLDAAPGAAPIGDAMVTASVDLGLVVLVADCVPVLLSSADGQVVGVVHAGRQGMMKGIVGQAVTAMRDLGSHALTAAVGPSICGRCYEVPDSLRAEAAGVVPESAARSWTGTPAIDVAAGVVAQLDALDVAIEWVPGCSREDEGLFSHRRTAPTGRFGGVIAKVAS